MQNQAQEESAGSHTVATQLNYKIQSLAAPKYAFAKINPLSYPSANLVPAASTADFLFEIPVTVFNWSESYLTFDMVIPIQTGSQSTWLWADTIPFRQIDITDKNGAYLLTIPEVQNYIKTIGKLFTPYDEFRQGDPSNLFFPSDRLASNAATGNATVTANNGSPTNSYVEPQYVLNTLTNLGTLVTATTTFRCQIPLKRFKKTILAMNKDVVYSSILQMRLQAGPGRKSMWAGVAAGTDPGGAQGLTGDFNMNNLTLWLAKEVNEDIANATKALQQSDGGLKTLVDYPYMLRNSLQTQQQTTSARISGTNGRNLLGIVTTFYDATGENAGMRGAYDNFNVTTPAVLPVPNGPVKIQSYSSWLDGSRLQPTEINCGMTTATGISTMDDYRENKRHMANTCFIDAVDVIDSAKVTDFIHNHKVRGEW